MLLTQQKCCEAIFVIPPRCRSMLDFVIDHSVWVTSPAGVPHLLYIPLPHTYQGMCVWTPIKFPKVPAGGRPSTKFDLDFDPTFFEGNLGFIFQK